MKKDIHVVGAVVVSAGKVLCVQRGPDGALPGLWEFPGGKIESGETPQEALVREIQEELRCEVAVGEEVTTTSHEYDFGVVHLTTFYCDLVERGASTHRSTHNWCGAILRTFGDLDWAPADIPAVELIEQRLGRSTLGVKPSNGSPPISSNADTYHPALASS